MRYLGLFLLAAALGCGSSPSSGRDFSSGRNLQNDSQARDAEQRQARDARAIEGERPDSLRILSYNLRHDRDHWQVRFGMIARELARLRPHLIGAQEVEIGVDQTRALADRLAAIEGPNYYVYERLKYGDDAKRGEGLAIYSQFPFVQTDWCKLGHGRIALFARVKLPDGSTLDVHNTHLHDKGGDSVRVEQVETLLAWVQEKSSGKDAVLLGDFNATPESDTIGRISPLFEDAHSRANPSTDGYTSPITMTRKFAEQKLTKRIDYVFYRLDPTNWHLQSTVNVMTDADDTGLMPSDHLGVLATYVRRAPQATERTARKKTTRRQ